MIEYYLPISLIFKDIIMNESPIVVDEHYLHKKIEKVKVEP